MPEPRGPLTIRLMHRPPANAPRLSLGPAVRRGGKKARDGGFAGSISRHGGRGGELHLCHEVQKSLAQDRIFLLGPLVIGRAFERPLGQFGADDNDVAVLYETEVAALRDQRNT